MSKETASLRSRGWWEKPTMKTEHGSCCSTTGQCFDTCSNFAPYLHRNNPRNIFIIAQAALVPWWKPVFSWHHHDAAPRDCTEGGDKEPIEKQDGESEPLLHQHFPAKPQVKLTRSISIIILWRDHKSVWIKNDLPLTSEWQHWIWLAVFTHHLELAMQAKAQPQWTLVCEVDWYFPQATTSTNCSTLKHSKNCFFQLLTWPHVL